MKRWLLLTIGVTAVLIGAIAFAGEGVAETSVNVSSVSARTSANLGPGWKAVRCSVEVFFRTGNSSVTAVTTDMPIPATTNRPVYITAAEPRIAFITGGLTGTCQVFPLQVGPNGAPPDVMSVNGAAISPASVTASGTITADRYVATGGDCAVSLLTPASICFEGEDAQLAYNGTSLVTNVDLDAANLTATDITAGQKVKGAIFALSSTTDLSSVVLSSGTPSTATATVRSGALCFCQNRTTQANPVRCNVSGTTLTVTGPNSVTDTVNYLCITQA